jgi:hypothetical protein
MATLIRHLSAIVAFPVTVTVIVPLWLARRNGIVLAPGRSAAELGLQVAGLLVLATGMLLFGGWSYEDLIGSSGIR